MDQLPFLLDDLSMACGYELDWNGVTIAESESDTLPSVFGVTEFAVASIANAALLARRVAAWHGGSPTAAIRIDRRLASIWFGTTIKPIGWELPEVWDPIAGNYRCGDRFIRLHTNAPHHRAAAISVLGCDDTRDAVTDAVAAWDPIKLERAIFAAGGVAAAFRNRDEGIRMFGEGPRNEDLVQRQMHDAWGPEHEARLESVDRARRSLATVRRPLAGVRVLDLTRVLAGPVATRLLAGLGADVLRIDPRLWNEAGVGAEVNLGKRCARLDLSAGPDRAVFERLLGQADILVHGYRPGALAGLGFDDDRRRTINPGLVDVSLRAWRHHGPWFNHRGFDSVVQIATGIAHEGMVGYGLDEPKPLPVQALDHATGYTAAACALYGWLLRLMRGDGSIWNTSLTAHAELLWTTVSDRDKHVDFEPLGPADLEPGAEEMTSWGPARRARPPFTLDGVEISWPNGAADHGTSAAQWANSL